MIDGVHLVKSLKRKVLYRYIRALERMDPGVANHLLGAQREFFLAGKSFFETEAGHAERAMAKMQRKMDHKEL